MTIPPQLPWGGAVRTKIAAKGGEDKSGMFSIWKNQRIHIMPFGMSRLNQFPAPVGEKIESMIRRFLI